MKFKNYWGGIDYKEPYEKLKKVGQGNQNGYLNFFLVLILKLLVICVAQKSPSDRTLCENAYNDEHCARVWDNRQATVKWLSNTFYDRIQTNPQIPPQFIVDVASKEW